MVRSVVGAISFLRRPAFDEEIFSEATEGLSWLESRRGKLPELRRTLTAWGLAAK